MTVPGVAPKGNQNITRPAQGTGKAAAASKRQEVAKVEKARVEVVQADRAEISTAARALAEVAMNSKPSLQLSSQDLRALTGGLPD